MSVPAAFLTARPAAASSGSATSASTDGGAGFGTALEAAAEALPGLQGQSGNADRGTGNGSGTSNEAGNTAGGAAAAAGLPYAAAPVLDGSVLPTVPELHLSPLPGPGAVPAEAEGVAGGPAEPEAFPALLPGAGGALSTAAASAAAAAAAAKVPAVAAASAAAAAAVTVQANVGIAETPVPVAVPEEGPGSAPTPAAPGQPTATVPATAPATAAPAAAPVPASPATGAVRTDQVPPSAPAAVPAAGSAAGNPPAPAATETDGNAAVEPGKAGPAPAQPAAPVMAVPAVAVPAVSATAPVQAPAPAQPAPLLTQVTQPLFSLSTASTGEHVMTLSVTPENLGPVTVRAHVSPDGIRVELFAPNDAGREALRSILTDLRRDLSGAGMNTSLSLSAQDQPGSETGRRGEAADSGTGRHGTEPDASPLPVQQIFRSVEHGPYTTLDILA
ncbi:flagellar hook-length control protein FliK [Arthrobacter koreensis]|uniref:flagellar hook-length control protein FliK n=1 Tax=Arthrobacter koreensis TaxID=199136 RepID=UPI003AC03BC7